MNVSVPEFTRCCCCLPLRLGIIVFGYIKLSTSLLFLSLTIMNIIEISGDSFFMTNGGFEIILEMTLHIAVLFSDISFCIVFLVGGYRKNHRLMRMYYYCSIVILVFDVIWSIYYSIRVGVAMFKILEVKYLVRFFKWTLGITMVSWVLQIYFIVLLRSEIIKLERNRNFRFRNLQAEAQNELLVENQVMNNT